MSLIAANPTFVSFFHAKPEEIAGPPLGRWIGTDEATWISRQLRALAEGSAATVKSESRTARADRSVAWLSWSAAAVRKPDGGIRGFSQLIRDVETLDVAEVRSFSDEVYREARRLDRMLEHVVAARHRSRSCQNKRSRARPRGAREARAASSAAFEEARGK